MSENNSELAGISSDHLPAQEERNPDTAREVFPVSFEKDFMDFSAKPELPEEGVLAPKSSTAPASVEPQRSVTGLEDLSEEDLANSAPETVAKAKSQSKPEKSGSGSQTSRVDDLSGKTEPHVVT